MKDEAAKLELQKTIIEGADRLFLTYGCKRVTMDQIAQELHISKRTIYEQFEDKRALLDACLRSKFESSGHAHRHISKIEETNDLLMLLTMIQNHASSRNHHEKMIEDLKEYYSDIYEKYFEEMMNRLVVGLEKMLLMLQEKQQIRSDINAKIAARTIMTLATLNSNNRLMEGVKEDDEKQILSEIIFTFMRGLLTEDMIHQYESKREQLMQQWKEHTKHCCC